MESGEHRGVGGQLEERYRARERDSAREGREGMQLSWHLAERKRVINRGKHSDIKSMRAVRFGLAPLRTSASELAPQTARPSYTMQWPFCS